MLCSANLAAILLRLRYCYFPLVDDVSPRLHVDTRVNMASKESNLPALYTELNKLGQNGEYERALKTANRSEH